MKKYKAVILFSGGLDSILAVKILQEQKIELLGICFKSYFFDAKQAKKFAEMINLPLKVVDFSKQHLEIVKNPKYGYGKAINPCIDCHTLMLKIAKKKFAKQIENNDIIFVANGDVLNQRPMSQNKQALEIIEKNSGLKGYLLRPLSAKLLNPTIAEQKKYIDRKKLLDIQGKSRTRQSALIKKYKIKQYPSPSGGCILTDKEFAKRMRSLFEIYPEFGYNDIRLLKLGRHFWEKKQKIKIIIGRNEKENKQIKKLAIADDILVEMKNYTGPITLIRNYRKSRITQSTLKQAKKLTQFYSTKARNKKDVKFI
ncbi:MAG: tRNA 4-thiouridine(8) synthase ThiI [Patescibacteria group bacterium]|nr:tRNA 4-thiouridine(8) synthase ThiI [Patescibacteria group bacterium]